MRIEPFWVAIEPFSGPNEPFSGFIEPFWPWNEHFTKYWNQTSKNLHEKTPEKILRRLYLLPVCPDRHWLPLEPHGDGGIWARTLPMRRLK
jgi:hypothetical protein